MYDYDFDINDNFTMESDLIKMSKELDEYSNQCNYIITNRHLYQEGVFDSIRRGARNIWEWFKGLLRKLLSVLQWIGRKIRSLFKKDKVSIDQIVTSCGIQPKKKHVHEAEDMLACVQEYMKHAAVIFPEAVMTYKEPDKYDLSDYKSRLDDLYWDYPDLRDIRSDIHIKNIGFNYRNQVVCIDYGNAPIKKG